MAADMSPARLGDLSREKPLFERSSGSRVRFQAFGKAARGDAEDSPFLRDG